MSTQLIGEVSQSFGFPPVSLTPIVNADFSWFNQGGATLEASNQHVAIIAPSGAGSNLRIREKAVPAAPYTVELGFIPMLPTRNFYSCGIVLRESGSGKCLTPRFETHANDFSFDMSKWTDASTFSATYAGSVLTQNPQGCLLFIRLVDDNTNYKMSMSFDGRNFWQQFSVSRTDFLTADKIGFFVDAETATPDGIVTFYSWAQS